MRSISRILHSSRIWDKWSIVRGKTNSTLILHSIPMVALQLSFRLQGVSGWFGADCRKDYYLLNNSAHILFSSGFPGPRVRAWLCWVCEVPIQTMSCRHVQFRSPSCLWKSLRVGRQFDKIIENSWETPIKNWPRERHGKLHESCAEHIGPLLKNNKLEKRVSRSLQRTQKEGHGSRTRSFPSQTRRKRIYVNGNTASEMKVWD